MRLIDADAIKYWEHTQCYGHGDFRTERTVSDEEIAKMPTVDAISKTEIEAYLQARLDEWEALGDRKFEPANMWGYNFIMACFDDLEKEKV